MKRDASLFEGNDFSEKNNQKADSRYHKLSPFQNDCNITFGTNSGFVSTKSVGNPDSQVLNRQEQTFSKICEQKLEHKSPLNKDRKYIIDKDMAIQNLAKEPRQEYPFKTECITPKTSPLLSLLPEGFQKALGVSTTCDTPVAKDSQAISKKEPNV